MANENSGSLIENGLYRISGWLGIFATVALCFMMVITVIDVGGRYLFNSPLFGAYELVGMLLVWAGPLGMALCQKQRGHIQVNLIVDLLPQRIQHFLASLGLLLSFVTYSIITWQMAKLTIYYYSKGQAGVSSDLGISQGHVSIVFTIGAFWFSLILLLHFVQSLSKLKGR